VATISRLLTIIGLFCRISSLLYGSFAKETYNFKEPTTRSHLILSACSCHTHMCMHKNARTFLFIGMCIFICNYTHAYIVRYIYTYVHVYIHIYVYTFIYICVYGDLHRATVPISCRVQADMCMCIYVYIYKCIYVYTYLHTCVYIYIYVNIYVYIYIYIYIYI